MYFTTETQRTRRYKIRRLHRLRRFRFCGPIERLGEKTPQRSNSLSFASLRLCVRILAVFPAPTPAQHPWPPGRRLCSRLLPAKRFQTSTPGRTQHSTQRPSVNGWPTPIRASAIGYSPASLPCAHAPSVICHSFKLQARTIGVAYRTWLPLLTGLCAPASAFQLSR
jgi:hypothetical protein